MNTKTIPGGLVIIFEGPDGTGKTTLCENLFLKLLNQNWKVSKYSEPPKTEFGSQIKKLILNNNLDTWTEFFLFTAMRNELFIKNIIPDLSEGKIVLLDRSFISSFIYQSILGDFPLSAAKLIADIATFGIIPDLIFYITASPDIIQKRIKGRNSKISKFEQNLEDVVKAYDTIMSLLAYEGYNIVKIENDTNIQETSKIIYSHFIKLVESYYEISKI